MSPAEFIARHEAEWESFERLLNTRLRTGKDKDKDKNKDAAPTATVAEFPALYRRICRHLALAIERRYPQELVDRLNALALAGQQRLYRADTRLWPTIARFLAGGFAAHVRRHARVLALALALLYVPLIAATVAAWQAPHLVYSLLAPEQVAEYEQMYDGSRQVIGYLREDDENLLMFGFYIKNNVGIGFQTFAGGIFAGVGSLVVLLSNGIDIGFIAGFLTARGHGPTFWQFVCGHSAFELNAIALCGMSGLLLGHALIAPGRRRRGDALAAAARDAVPILYGAAFMLFVAAIIEAFWSSRTVIPPPAKFAAAGLWWLLVALYFLRAGRGTESTHAS